MADPRHHAQVLPLETQPVRTGKRSRWGTRGEHHLDAGRPTRYAGGVGAGADGARGDGTPAATLPGDDRTAVLRATARAVQRSGATPQPSDRLDRFHSRPLPQAAEKAFAGEGVL